MKFVNHKGSFQARETGVGNPITTAVHLIKKQIRADLITIGYNMYNQVMEGLLPSDDLYDLIIQSLPSCFPQLNTSTEALQEMQNRTASAAQDMCQMDNRTKPQIQLELESGPARGASADGSPDLACLRVLLYQTLQSAAWYAERSRKFGADLSEYRDGFLVGLHALADPSLGLGGLLSRVLEAGQLVAACAALLTETAKEKLNGKVNNARFVRPIPGSLIVTGADLNALQDALQGAEQWQIPVFTSGELAHAHGFADLDSKYLMGHVDLEDQANDFAGVSILYTDFMPVKLPNIGLDRIFTCGFARTDEARHLSTLQGENEILWKAMAVYKKGHDLEVLATFLTGWTNETLFELRDSILVDLQAGTVNSLVFIINSATGDKMSCNQESSETSGKEWRLVAGEVNYEIGVMDKAAEDGQQYYYFGSTPDILGGVQLLKILAGDLQTSIRGVPHRVEIPLYREEMVGILFGLMSFGLQGFCLGRQWQGVFTERVLDLLQDRWQVKIADKI
jgi:hypothetical protein